MSTNVIKARVEGMTCDKCVAHVTHALESVPGVVSAQVSLEGASADIVANDSVTAQQLADTVKSAGYVLTV
ncbi:copper-transporting ATPase 1 [Advenella kashmirensis WT001]|uniref:Copper-transporting ATPase 1 n=1 Tax=Advenella kashmirensis (strain DSM 17095 / LMG 22695 / WT001) TaxID=1036672 RepID=I3U7L0_ADVKW|nr:cation transporter [Advenella kashmirensis]AFK60998.1 copper-transporting ATPase 1 [Advenella kashmirensis WT001]